MSVDGRREGGFFDDKEFLFSGGFMLSGKNADTVWSNGNASSSQIEDYLPGIAQGFIDDENDPRFHLYVVKSGDEPFGESWQEWKDAVDLGAYFYDGDDDGIYNPTDKNGDGVWNPDEDMPDLLGDETVWCVYNDALDESLRFFWHQDPVGIEMRQTVWAYADSNYLGNVVFVRWSINNAGTVADVFDSVYFGAWADADIGNLNGDLSGSDTTLMAGYTYNDGPDSEYGVNPPCFIISLLQGAKEETGNPEDMAFNVKGPNLGIDTIFGAVNLPMTSFIHYMSSHPTQGNPDNITQARNYLVGKTHQGEFNDPCTDAFGVVLGGVDCNTINPLFWHSGDPTADKGWINIAPFDQYQMSNVGPFTLEKDKPVDIIVAYVVGRGTDHLNSITKAKEIAEFTHFFYQNNFDENVVSVEDINISSIPNDYNLFQNFPNPFNPATTIEFSVPKPDKVKLIVFDLLGREVEILVNEEKPQGNYKVTFNASSFPSGVYFYQLITEHYSDTKKMIYLK